jgi:hypothetical protein
MAPSILAIFGDRRHVSPLRESEASGSPAVNGGTKKVIERIESDSGGTANGVVAAV